MDDAKSSSPIDGHYHYGEKSKRECAICRLEAERNRLRDKVRLLNERILADTRYAGKLVIERDRLRTVVKHAIETLSESASDAPGVLATVDLMRLALDPTGEDTCDG